MEDKKQLIVEINGTVFSEHGDVDEDEFLEAFIQMVESKGWAFGGGTKQLDEDGNYIKD
ncbi:hypothetical protein ACIQW7_11260 [Peribacillus simplex]|uniref:hypothetical protein n=1 Tax=Peribacillus simplex TaxID=1478 RepID=UPI003821BFB1